MKRDLQELHVIAAGSLLEFELRNISTPVGRIQFVYVYPLSFAEYLAAMGKENLRSMLMENDFLSIPEPIHKQLLREIRNTSTGKKEKLKSGSLQRSWFQLFDSTMIGYPKIFWQRETNAKIDDSNRLRNFYHPPLHG